MQVHLTLLHMFRQLLGGQRCASDLTMGAAKGIASSFATAYDFLPHLADVQANVWTEHIGDEPTMDVLFNSAPQCLNTVDLLKSSILQANVWTEYIGDEPTVEYMLLPRMCAMAEVLFDFLRCGQPLCSMLWDPASIVA